MSNTRKIYSKIISIIMIITIFIATTTYSRAMEINDQIILVVGNGGYKATVSLYEKNNNGAWNRTISSNGYVGKNGITDNKKEGDGKTPSGIYGIGTSFGIYNNPGTNLPYRKVTKNDYWVDDSNSRYYNQWVDITKVDKDWKSAEHLYSEKVAYKYSLVVNYNTENILPGKGSAIFLHNSTGGYTAGCISIPENTLVSILKKLKPTAKIVIAKDANSIPKPKDDITGHWAESIMKEFINKGYLSGYEDGTFRPNNSITRAEFVKILNKVFNLTKGSGKVFNDTTNHWAKHEIDIAITNGVCTGKSLSQFKPNDPITREEASVMISNYKKLADNNLDKLNKYNDANIVSKWAKPSVEGMIEKNYMSGYSDNTFRPKDNITRAEAAATLSRIN